VKILGNDGHCFVGYYDIDPVSADGNSILCHRVPLKYTSYSTPESGEIGLLDINSNIFTSLEVTRAINWQLGSRVQWIDDNSIAYNDIINGKQCSLIYDVSEKRVTRHLQLPFWAIAPDRKMAASLNFARLRNKRPGYGYSGAHSDGDAEAITIYSLEDDQILYKVSLTEILEQTKLECPLQSDPYLNHVAWSACSSKLLTLVHYHDPHTNARRIFPILLNLNTSSAHLISNTGLFSHHTWIGSERILAYLKVGQVPRFSLWDEETGWVEIGSSMPQGDGHPTAFLDGKRVVVDSYPNRMGNMSLFMGGLNNDLPLKKIGKIRSHPDYQVELRCDLHPRISNRHNLIICDAPFNDGRKIFVLSKFDNV
jgi:hypothetical protein